MSKIDIEDRRRFEAATKIQKVFRGHIARKLYNDLLCQKMIELEE